MANNFVPLMLGESKQRVLSTLPPENSLDANSARMIIRRYAAVFEGNFVSWMSAGVISARSPYARFAATENIWVELRDNHPGMLKTFAVSCGALPHPDDVVTVLVEVDAIRKLVGELSGIKCIALMAFLENTSEVFIPYLASLAHRLGSSNYDYTNVHGKADALHAEQFLKALEEESVQSYPNPQGDIEEVFCKALLLLKSIFAI